MITPNRWITLDIVVLAVAYIFSLLFESMSDCTGNDPYTVATFVALVICGLAAIHAMFIFVESQRTFQKKTHLAVILTQFVAGLIIIGVVFGSCGIGGNSESGENAGIFAMYLLLLAIGMIGVALHMKFSK